MTDTELIAAAVQKAGGYEKLASLDWTPTQVTIWRWRQAGRIPKPRDRRLLEQYVRDGQEVA